MTSGDFTAYIHVPFCARRCPYCAFYSETAQSRDTQARYLDALEYEIISRVEEWRAGGSLPPENRRFSCRAATMDGCVLCAARPCLLSKAGPPPSPGALPQTPCSPSGGARTIYIGGGTPTLLDAPLLARLLGIARAYLAGPATIEFTVEALACTITPEKAAILADAGVGRVTLGAQSTERAVLEGVGRTREYDALPHAIAILRQAGIRNIGVDLIIGLPQETLKGFRRGLDRLLELECPHISAYILSIEEGTPFAEARKRAELREAPDWKTRRNYTALCLALRRAGYEHYEVSNFALRGYACLHNIATWTQRAQLGFGAGAVGTDWSRAARRHNVASLEFASNPAPAYTEEILSARDIYRETLLLGLRTRGGICDDLAFAESCGFPPDPLREKLEGFVRAGLLRREAKRYMPTLRGMLWLDAMLVELF